jgi:hypothetical protein
MDDRAVNLHDKNAMHGSSLCDLTADTDDTMFDGWIRYSRKRFWNNAMPSSAIGKMMAGECLRYLAIAAPDQCWSFLSPEQLPMEGESTK